MEKRLLKGVHTTPDDGHDGGDSVGLEEDLSEPRSEDFSSRRLPTAATADLDFVQASLRAESRGEEMSHSVIHHDQQLFN